MINIKRRKKIQQTIIGIITILILTKMPKIEENKTKNIYSETNKLLVKVH